MEQIENIDIVRVITIYVNSLKNTTIKMWGLSTLDKVPRSNFMLSETIQTQIIYDLFYM